MKGVKGIKQGRGFVRHNNIDYLGEGKRKSIFLIFRIFDHDPDDPNRDRRELRFLNLHEKFVGFEKTEGCDRERGFAHVEIITNDRRWFGIINSSTCKDGVFLKDKISYGDLKEEDLRRDIKDYYPQVVQIQVTAEEHDKLLEFAEEHKGEKFGSFALSWNMGWHHMLNLGWLLSKINTKRTWYCTKLVIDALKHARIIGKGSINSLTATSEDIFAFCVTKSKSEDSSIAQNRMKKENQRFYIYPYKDYPENFII